MQCEVMVCSKPGRWGWHAGLAREKEETLSWGDDLYLDLYFHCNAVDDPGLDTLLLLWGKLEDGVSQEVRV